MKKILLSLSILGSILICPLLSSGHLNAQASPTHSPEKEINSVQWVENLYEMGVQITEDSMRLTAEARRVVSDSMYRIAIYRDVYHMQGANLLFSLQQYKIAFWHLLNVYTYQPDMRNIVVEYILSFDRALDMERVLTAVFYTYAFFDPAIGPIVNGKPDIQHPEVMDEKLARTKELVNAIHHYRSQKG